MIKQLLLILTCLFLTMPLLSKSIDSETDLYGVYEITLPSKTKLSASLEDNKITIKVVSEEEGKIWEINGSWDIEGSVLIAVGTPESVPHELKIDFANVTAKSLKRGVFITATLRVMIDDGEDQDESVTTKMLMKKIN